MLQELQFSHINPQQPLPALAHFPTSPSNVEVEKQRCTGVCLVLLPRVVEGRAGSGVPRAGASLFQCQGCVCLPSVPRNAQLQKLLHLGAPSMSESQSGSAWNYRFGDGWEQNLPGILQCCVHVRALSAPQQPPCTVGAQAGASPKPQENGGKFPVVALPSTDPLVTFSPKSYNLKWRF